MSILTGISPMRWPAAYPATPLNRRAFNNSFPSAITLDEALAFLEDELVQYGAEKAVVMSDYEHLTTARLRRRVGNHPGAVLEMRLPQGREYCLACDRWPILEHNLYALHLTLRQYWHMLSWGVADLDRLMQGFFIGAAAAHVVMPSGNHSGESWRIVLGLGATANLEDAEAVYRRRAKLVAHDMEQLRELNLAIDAARKVLKRSVNDVTERRRYPSVPPPDGVEKRKNPATKPVD